MGILLSHYNDPYEPTSEMESKRFFPLLGWFPSTWKGWGWPWHDCHRCCLPLLSCILRKEARILSILLLWWLPLPLPTATTYQHLPIRNTFQTLQGLQPKKIHYSKMLQDTLTDFYPPFRKILKGAPYFVGSPYMFWMFLFFVVVALWGSSPRQQCFPSRFDDVFFFR